MSLKGSDVIVEYKPDVSNGPTVVSEVSGRPHFVTIDERVDGYWLTDIVLKRKDQTMRGKLAVRVWTRNRAANLVGFRFTKKGDLIGECFVPKAGLTKEEFELCVGKVARECDRMEYILTGEDNE